MSKSFKTYLEESQKQYGYCIRTILAPTDEIMDRIERLLGQFDLVDISSAEKVSARDSLEFRDLANQEISAINFSLGMPMSSYVLQQELRAALNVPENEIVVRGDNEPVELEDNRRQMLSQLNQIARDRDLRPGSLLSTDRYYLDAEQPIVKDAYGDKYNKKFLEFLADIASKRKPTEFEAQSQHISLRDLKAVRQEPTQDVADFNDAYDTPKPVSRGRGKNKPPVDPALTGAAGNFDGVNHEVFKLSRNRNGKLITTTAKKVGK